MGCSGLPRRVDARARRRAQWFPHPGRAPSRSARRRGGDDEHRPRLRRGRAAQRHPGRAAAGDARTRLERRVSGTRETRDRERRKGEKGSRGQTRREYETVARARQLRRHVSRPGVRRRDHHARKRRAGPAMEPRDDSARSLSLRHIHRDLGSGFRRRAGAVPARIRRSGEIDDALRRGVREAVILSRTDGEGSPLALQYRDQRFFALLRMTELHRVVIVGSGFGGLYAAKALRKAPAQITIVDRRNFHLFQPLHYQVATAALNPSDIAYPIRSVVAHQQNTNVILADGEIAYDYLIVATGATHSYFKHPEWMRFAPGLKTIEDALEIRRRVLLAFESAERETDV